MLDPFDFYISSLATNNIERKPEDINKFASEKGIDVEIAKLAKLYYEQLQLDAIEYDDEKDRALDAMKLASAFFQNRTEETEAACKIATGLVEYLSFHVGNYLKLNSINLPVVEALKVAALEAESKEAMANPMSPIMSANDPALYTNSFAPGGASLVKNEQALQELAQMHAAEHLAKGADPHKALNYVYSLPHNTKKEDTASFGSQVRQAQTTMPNMSLEKAIAHAKGQTPAHSGGMMASIQKHPGWAAGLGVGAAGLGALYMMHRKHQEDEEGKDRQMAALRSAAMPAM